MITKIVNDWLNSIFFVKAAGPRLAIGLGSAAICVAVFIGLHFYRRAHVDCFLNQHGWLFSMFVSYIASIGVGFIVCFSACAVYNICKR